ncbi:MULTISPECIES: hypothetical protein [Acinetobacter]|uniref:Uncharacterized protein n=1 Tax=Acinetobacter piscicola TaxID=2006115 RepID=A0A7S7AHT6_9GAMM|nr:MULTISPECIES: hypothetical protein [Acinetobacter]QOW46462.1 hypothetical protein G0028_11455 [Acinetobacter piscicola]
MKNLLKGIKQGDLVEFDLITNPIEIDEVDDSNEHYVKLTFKCHSGYWVLDYKWDGTQSNCLAETGIHDAFDIVKVTRK